MEEENNIEWFCEDCSKEKYKNKGTWTAEDLKKYKFVKKKFTSKNSDGPKAEHMWIEIVTLEPEGVTGLVSNNPVLKDIPRYGTATFVKYEDIEDVM